MTAIIIVGPEKSGKTTLCLEIIALAKRQGLSTEYHHRTGKDPFTKADAMSIIAYDNPGILTIYDRAWPCAVVYHSFGYKQLYSAIGRKAEETVGKYIRQGHGETIVLLGPSPEEMAAKRTPDDWPIAPAIEQAAYKAYGERHNWRIIADYVHSREALRTLAAEILFRNKR